MKPQHKEVLLANGGTMPLDTVAGILSLLQTLLAGKPEDRELVHCLRKDILEGGKASPEFKQEMIDSGLANPDGSIDYDVKRVVRIALRGHGKDLHLVSPYTTSWDKTVSDLLISLNKVRNLLPPDQVKELLNASTGPATAAPASEPGTKSFSSWSEYVKKRILRGDDLPPPGSN